MKTEPPSVSVRRRGSIAARLAWLYLGATGAMLLVAAGFLYWGVGQSLRAQDERLLESKIRVLRILLRDPGKAEALASEIEHEAGEDQELKYYMRILTADGRVRLETPEMGRLLPAAVFPKRELAARRRPWTTPHTEPSGREFLLLTASAAVGPTGAETRLLQLALDTSHNRALMADARGRLSVVLCAGMLFAAVAGVLVTRAGLKPLDEITRATRRVTASKLHERLTPANWPAELRELARAFDAMLDRLEDSFARLAQCSADLAHELRTPINNLRGEAEVALARAREPEEYQQILASSLEEYERLTRMIDGVLFVARAEQPDVAVKRVRFEARDELEAVREFYSALAGEQDVNVTCEGEATLAADPMLFRRAVSNLLANALNHTPAGGLVVLSTRKLADHSVEIAVRDTGFGIAPKHLRRIFDRFYRADQSRSERRQGVGLGLAIVQSIVRLHGGTAAISSIVEEGTTVTLTFPYVAEAASAPSAEKTVISPSSSCSRERSIMER